MRDPDPTEYIDDKIKLLCGDFFELTDKIQGGYDLLLTDPPWYTPAKISQTRKEFRRSLGNMGVMKAFFIAFAERIEHQLSPTGHLYLFCDSRTHPFISPAFYEMTKDIRAIIWDKKVAGLGYTWRRQYEMIIFGTMPQSKPVETGDGDIIRHRSVPIDEREHPAQKPIPLLKKLILKSTKEGDIVFDPFMGSGSTGVAAMETGRRFIGVEYSQQFFNLARDRITQRPIQRGLV